MATLFRNRLFWFFFLAFVLAWGTWIPAFFIRGFPPLLSMIGLFAPAIAAVGVAMSTRGKRGLSELFGRFLIWRFEAKWYALAIGLMPLAYAFAAVADAVVFRTPVQSIWAGGPMFFLVASFIWLLAITSGEEIGWRGFALPAMLGGDGDRPRAYTVSLLLGIIWAVWHAPVFLSGEGSLPYPIFLLLAIALSFVYTALFIRSGGSLCPAILLHATTDFAPRIIRLGALTNAFWIIVTVFVAAAGIAMLEPLRESRRFA